MPAIMRTHNNFQWAIRRVVSKLKKGVDYKRSQLIELADSLAVLQPGEQSRVNFWKALVKSDTMYQVVHWYWTLRHKGPRRTSLKGQPGLGTPSKVPLIEFELKGGFVEIYFNGRKKVVVDAS